VVRGADRSVRAMSTTDHLRPSATPPGGSSTSDTSPLGPRGVRWLKIAVVGMGVLILVGVTVIVARIIYLASRPSRPAGVTASAIVAPQTRVALPAGAGIKHLSLSGDRLAIGYDGPSGPGIAIVDTATGQVISRVEVVPEPPR
jgi:hypothetical protein